MNPLENNYVNLTDLFQYYFDRSEKETMNMKRIKRFYTDEDSFNVLMNKIIDKDNKRFERLTTHDIFPDPWRILFIILDIAQYEGTYVKPFDVLTKSFPSRTLKYMGWTFSLVHGENSVTSIYNREDELVYRF